MILGDIYSYLAQSETLQTALGGTAQESKIYPNYARVSSKTPYIVYRSDNPGGTTDEVLSEELCSFIITAESFSKTVEISWILTLLLDLTQQNIPSQNHIIFYSKKIGGNDFTDELGRHVRVLNFIFKFKQK